MISTSGPRLDAHASNRRLSSKRPHRIFGSSQSLAPFMEHVLSAGAVARVQNNDHLRYRGPGTRTRWRERAGAAGRPHESSASVQRVGEQSKIARFKERRDDTSSTRVVAAKPWSASRRRRSATARAHLGVPSAIPYLASVPSLEHLMVLQVMARATRHSPSRCGSERSKTMQIAHGEQRSRTKLRSSLR